MGDIKKSVLIPLGLEDVIDCKVYQGKVIAGSVKRPLSMVEPPKMLLMLRGLAIARMVCHIYVMCYDSAKKVQSV